MVELKKYTGKWYEIASFPQWFQKGCTNTTAEYDDKGKFIEVKNTCAVDTGKKQCDDKVCIPIYKEKQKIGKAFTTKDPDLLRIQFFFPFRGDYLVEHVDADYQHAIVGNKNKKYLWILSRKPQISEAKEKELYQIIEGKGYDLSKLQKTSQFRNINKN